MFLDLNGKTRAKVGLHIHTNISDGKATPERAAEIYKAAGYDAIALTDHWKFGQEQTIGGLKILSGCEYNFGSALAENPVYHIVGVGMTHDPEEEYGGDFKTATQGLSVAEQANLMIEAIRKAGGLVILAHPAWSINTPEHIKRLRGVEATEIYNAVSDCGMSNRPYSGAVVDMLASEGKYYPLLATDDTHYYAEDACRAWISAEVEDVSRESILDAVRNEKFYATQGPEVHLFRDGDGFTVRCSPVSKIVFMSNMVWAPRITRGNGVTEAHYVPRPGESYLRVEVTDESGKYAFTNIVSLRP